MKAVSREVRGRTRLGVCVQCTFPILAAVRTGRNYPHHAERAQGLKGAACSLLGRLFGTSHSIREQYTGTMLTKSFFQLIYF